MVVVKKSVTVSRKLQPDFLTPENSGFHGFLISLVLSGKWSKRQASRWRKVNHMPAYGSSNSFARELC